MRSQRPQARMHAPGLPAVPTMYPAFALHSSLSAQWAHSSWESVHPAGAGGGGRHVLLAHVLDSTLPGHRKPRVVDPLDGGVGGGHAESVVSRGKK